MSGYVLFPPQEDSPGWRVTCPQTDGVCAVIEVCSDCPFNDGLWVAEKILVGVEQ